MISLKKGIPFVAFALLLFMSQSAGGRVRRIADKAQPWATDDGRRRAAAVSWRASFVSQLVPQLADKKLYGIDFLIPSPLLHFRLIFLSSMLLFSLCLSLSHIYRLD